VKGRIVIRLGLIGGRSMLAQKVKQLLPSKYQLIELNRPEFDLTDPNKVGQLLRKLKPQIIVNCAAFTQVDACETQQNLANAVNGVGPGLLARTARQIGAILVHVSSDYVFDGTLSRPYCEEDPPSPQSIYGQSKLLGEKTILASGLEKYFILRTGWLYGPGGNNFVETIARFAADREELRIVADQTGTPTYTGDLAAAIFALLETKEYGIFHYSNSGISSWYEFATEIVSQLQARGEAVKVKRVLPISTEQYPLPAKRPAYSVLSKEKYSQATGKEVPCWQDGLKRYMAERIPV
jgi:dTDP-4-dehydrorhamnose reductase